MSGLSVPEQQLQLQNLKDKLILVRKALQEIIGTPLGWDDALNMRNIARKALKESK